MKRVLLTGGSDGLGKVTAEKLKSAGFDVTILAVDEDKTSAAAKEIGCNYVVADVTDYKALKEAIMSVGEVDILINNAGIWIQGPFDEDEPDKIRRVMEVNALGMMNTSHIVIPSMKQRKQGRIINVMSQAGLQSKPDRATYHASKWAGTGFTNSLQEELKPFSISVVGFYPSALNNASFFEKAGIEKDVSKALDLGIVAEALVYICRLPDDVNVPQLGLNSLNY